MPPQKKRSRGSSKASMDPKADYNKVHKAGMMMDDSDNDSSDDNEEDLTFSAAPSGTQDDEMDGGEAVAGNVSVDFVFSDPREDHFHSVKQFLLAYLPPSQPFDVSGLANAVVGQVTAGTMVCVEGEDDVYGFITVLNLRNFEKETSIQQVMQYVIKKCPNSNLPKLQQILSTKNVGLVLNERMVNLPYQLVPALHSALHEDIEWAIENEDTHALRNSFQLDYFLILATFSEEKSGSSESTKSKKTKTAYEQTTKFFHNFEDEFLEQEAELTFSFDMPLTERERVDKSSKTTVVILLEREKHKAALACISAMINVKINVCLEGWWNYMPLKKNIPLPKAFQVKCPLNNYAAQPGINILPIIVAASSFFKVRASCSLTVVRQFCLKLKMTSVHVKGGSQPLSTNSTMGLKMFFTYVNQVVFLVGRIMEKMFRMGTTGLAAVTQHVLGLPRLDPPSKEQELLNTKSLDDAVQNKLIDEGMSASDEDQWEAGGRDLLDQKDKQRDERSDSSTEDELIELSDGEEKSTSITSLLSATRSTLSRSSMTPAKMTSPDSSTASVLL